MENSEIHHLFFWILKIYVQGALADKDFHLSVSNLMTGEVVFTYGATGFECYLLRLRTCLCVTLRQAGGHMKEETSKELSVTAVESVTGLRIIIFMKELRH